MKHYPFLIVVALLISCSDNYDPQKIINECIVATGSDKLSNAKVEFDFRGREYGVQRKGGEYEMVRLFKDSTGLVRDVVSNEGFLRELNGTKITVADSMAFKYTNSINSVIYFALLPYSLNDEAVNKKYLAKEKIKDNTYHKIEVTFNKENGGKDFEDVFIYWINTENKFIDYLAYSYKTDGGGMRFREAINPRTVNGLRVVDYINYQPLSDMAISETGTAFVEGKMKELSRIELDNFLMEAY